ncbi:Dscam [Cordylochernes scorpioides]|uniref:Dscam n=1 Tax=Cordylochernes scorpioides TaxID=51811 RepID=A0ABY6K2R0_9ARAC|nr:Dscam [Cordylochernes scorpioides]
MKLDSDESSSRLTISPLKRSDSALYTCTAVNTYGQDDTNIQLIIQECATEPPDAPREVAAAEVSSRQARLTWDPPFSGNSLISHYLVSFRQNDSAEWTNTSVPGAETGHQLTGLHPATGYVASVSAHNSVGPGPPSILVAFSTAEEAPEAPPRNVHVFPTGPDSLRVNWEKYLCHPLKDAGYIQGPLASQTNGPLAGYYVGYRPANSSEPLQYKSVEAPWAELRGLEPFTLYSVVVQAFNGAGAGPRADPVTAVTLEGVPKLPPQNIECTPQGTQTLLVTWAPVPENAVQGVLRGYKLLYATSRDYAEVEVPGTAQEATLNDLSHYTNYSLAVAAFTAQGDGVYSDPVYCPTPEDVPSPPADVRALPMLPDAILVSWLPPLYPNGIVLNYFLYQRTNHQSPKKHLLSGSQQFYEALRLARGQRYDFWVTAATSVGEGEPTRVLSQTTADIVPARIASFSEVLEVPPNVQVRLPCKFVGIPAPELTEWSLIPNVTAYTCTGGRSQPVKDNVLPNGTLDLGPYDPQSHTGNYTCRVQNVHGSDEIAYFLTSHCLSSQLSDCPERDSWIVLSVSSATTSSLELTWEQLLKPPFRPKEYVLRYKREFGQWEETKVPAHPAKFSLTGLRCGTVYSLYLSRPRDDGSPPSNVVTSRTLGSAPVAPDKEVFLTASNSTGLLLALGEWDDGGCPIKSFVVRYKSFWSTEWRVAPAAVTQPAPRPLYLGSLTPATWYHLRVTAHNGAGSTAAEYEMATLTWEGGTIAPVVPLETREHQPGVWDDVHLAVPVVVAILALLVVGGVALCVCLKRRHFQEEIYERPAPLQRKSLPCSTGKSPEGTQVRETSLYQTCLAKGGPPPNTQAPPSSQDLADYEDDITPYATFRVPGFDSDTESSQGTVRELQTFHEPHMHRDDD